MNFGLHQMSGIFFHQFIDYRRFEVLFAITFGLRQTLGIFFDQFIDYRLFEVILAMNFGLRQTLGIFSTRLSIIAFSRYFL